MNFLATYQEKKVFIRQVLKDKAGTYFSPTNPMKITKRAMRFLWPDTDISSPPIFRHGTGTLCVI